MKFIFTTSAVWLGSLALTGTLLAATVPSDGSVGAYQVVLDRNPFGLKPPPPPPKPDEGKQEAPPLNVKLSGISAFLGVKKAYLVTTEQGKKETEYVTLAEGEAVGNLEVIEIDERASTVKIRNGVVTKVLDLKNDSPKDQAPTGPPPQMMGGQAIPGGQPPQGGAPVPTVNSLGQPIHNQPAPGSNQPGYPGNTPGVNPAGSSPMKTIPSRTLRLPPGGKTSSYPVGPSGQKTDLSYEESALHMAVQQQINQPAIDAGDFPPLPPVN